MGTTRYARWRPTCESLTLMRGYRKLADGSAPGKRVTGIDWVKCADRLHNDRRMIHFLASRSVLKLQCADDISDDNADDSRASPHPPLHHARTSIMPA